MTESHLSKMIIFASVFILLTSCWTTNKFMKRATFDTSKVPADYNPQKHILLVEEIERLHYPGQRSNTQTNNLDKLLKEQFPYRYEIASKKEILENNSKYGDTSVYKYALLNSISSYAHSTTTTTTRTVDGQTYSYSVSPSAQATYIDFGFYDRLSDTPYPATGNPAPKLKYAVAVLTELVRRAKEQKTGM